MAQGAADLAQRWLAAQATPGGELLPESERLALLKLARADPKVRRSIAERLRGNPAVEAQFWEGCMEKLLDDDDAAHDPSRSIAIDRLRGFACSMMALKANSSCFRGLLTYVNTRYQFQLTVSSISHPLVGAGELVHLLGQIACAATEPAQESTKSFVASLVADSDEEEEMGGGSSSSSSSSYPQYQSLGFSMLYQLGLAVSKDGKGALDALIRATKADPVTRSTIDTVFPPVPAGALLEEAATKLSAAAGDTGSAPRVCGISGRAYTSWDLLGVSASHSSMSEQRLVTAALEQRMAYWIPRTISEDAYRRALHLTDPLRWPAQPCCIGIAVVPLVGEELRPMCEKGKGSSGSGASSTGTSKMSRHSKSKGGEGSVINAGGSTGMGGGHNRDSSRDLGGFSSGAIGARSAGGAHDPSREILAPGNIYSSSYKHDNVFSEGATRGFQPAPQVQKAGVVRAVGLFGRAGASSVEVVRAITLALIRQQSSGLLFYHQAYMHNHSKDSSTAGSAARADTANKGKGAIDKVMQDTLKREQAEREWWYKHMEEEVLHLLSANSSKKYMRELHRAAQVLDNGKVELLYVATSLLKMTPIRIQLQVTHAIHALVIHSTPSHALYTRTPLTNQLAHAGWDASGHTLIHICPTHSLARSSCTLSHCLTLTLTRAYRWMGVPLAVALGGRSTGGGVPWRDWWEQD
jgi:hypothetical protein